MRHPEWLEQDIDAMDGVEHSGLSIDFVALRDIKQGEEITIDYGTEWEEAWQEHAVQWSPVAGSDLPRTSLDFTSDPDSIIPTADDGGYGGFTKLWLHNIYRNFHGLPGHTIDYYMAIVVGQRQITVDDPNKRGRDIGEYLYTIEIYEYEEADEETTLEFAAILWDVDRDGFVFDDNPYSRDHQMLGVFRHPMMIPDDMFPEQWKNKLEE